MWSTVFTLLAFLCLQANSRIVWTEKWSTGQWQDRYSAFKAVRNNARVVNDPKGQMGRVLEVTYPPKVKASKGGFSFPAPLPNVAETKLCMSYSILFESGFPFDPQPARGLRKIGGKLPGLFGGTPGYKWYQCSGGRQPEDHDYKCFSTRFMWRDGGEGEVYGYIPSPTKEQCARDPPFHCAGHGHSLGRGNWKFPTNRWIKVSQEVELNSLGKRNGRIRAWVGNDRYGNPSLDLKNIMIRDKHSDSLIRGYYFSTFFGGGSLEWAPPSEVHAWFSDITISTSCQDVLGGGGGGSPPSLPPPSNPPSRPPSNPPSRPPSNPPSNPPPSGGCGGIRYRKAVTSNYYLPVVAPSGSLSIKCGNGKTIGCSWESRSKYWKCRSGGQGPCTGNRVAITNGKQCPIGKPVSNAEDANEVFEEAIDDAPTEQGTVLGSGAIAGIVVGCVVGLLLVVALVVVVKKQNKAHQERF